MSRILLSIVFGLPVFAVLIGVGESLQEKGTTVQTTAACVAAALYLMIAEFFVAPRGARGFKGKWSTMIATGVPVLVFCVLQIIGGGTRAWLELVVPCFIAGCVGIAAGAAVAGQVTFRALSSASCRYRLLGSAGVTSAVLVVLVVGAIPLTRNAGTFPDGSPGSTVSVFWGVVCLNALVAVLLGVLGFRAGRNVHLSFGGLALMAFLAFMSASTFVAPALAFRGHGPVLLAVSRLSLLCLVAEIIVTVLVASVALRLTDDRAA